MNVTQDYPTPTGVARLRVVYRPSAEQVLYDLWNVSSCAQAAGKSPQVDVVLPVKADNETSPSDAVLPTTAISLPGAATQRYEARWLMPT